MDTLTASINDPDLIPLSAYEAAGTPSVSVVVPTVGRADLLNRCLGALVAQSLDTADYEILIVDDGPSDATREIVEGWMTSQPQRIVYIANHGPHGPAAARNRGWQAARASIIAFTDDDTVPAPDWLAGGLAAFEPDVDVLRGRVVMPLPDVPTDYERDASHLETAEFVTANCFCRKAVLQALDGFDERFRYAWREDSDVHFRLLNAGATIRSAPGAVVEHPVRPARWGVSVFQQKKILFDALLYKKHPKLYRQRIRATPRWDYYLIAASLATGAAGAATGHRNVATTAGLVWLGMTARFFLQRIRGTTMSPSHVAEMALTSAVIPPIAVYWRMVGALRFKVRFF
ncbi:glycosyltransferase family 2 protein [Noviherbaspirillum pedocola]|uniref:Glycosyltransferase n=1 Tax=Noviherbaspirillum pedocola TaxID=2801341 RepID=A0A934T182_9BURK|nr:glycosyltransferase [Noviherbaspirillum pedocola]MBK4735593.1 glycosyltransferase [Noviherbaspirillum pedocola]